MFKVVKKIIDRFIEWLVTKSKGVTLEDKLMSALQTMAFVQTLLFWGCLSLIIVCFNQKVRLNDTEHAASMVKRIFDPQNNPLDQFARINQELSKHLNTMHDDNIVLIKDNLQLTIDKKYLIQENRLLSLEVSAAQELSKQCLNNKKKK